jgi:hypothetical protein
MCGSRGLAMCCMRRCMVHQPCRASLHRRRQQDVSTLRYTVPCLTQPQAVHLSLMPVQEASTAEWRLVSAPHLKPHPVPYCCVPPASCRRCHCRCCPGPAGPPGGLLRPAGHPLPPAGSRTRCRPRCSPHAHGLCGQRQQRRPRSRCRAGCQRGALHSWVWRGCRPPRCGG